MGDLKPKYLLEGFALTFDNKNKKKKKRLNYLRPRLAGRFESKHPFLLGCPAEGRRSIKFKILGKIQLEWD